MLTRIAYFSMEIMLETDIPSYAGGLGVLAGDILRSCADMKVPAIGISLVYSGSTFYQIVNADGSQTFVPVDWQRLDQLTKLPHRCQIELGDTTVTIACWRYDLVGLSGSVVPIILLDTNISENLEWVRNLTRNLYTGGPETRLCQEALLGFGGVEMLKKLNVTDISTYHLNEGHCSFVPLGLTHTHSLSQNEARALCTFTTHTPVPEGHDHFDYEIVYKYLKNYIPENLKELATSENLNMTHLGLNLSRVHLAVSNQHKLVCRHMFPNFEFTHITNGVHHRNWTWHAMQNLYDQHLPNWLENPEILKDSSLIPDDKLVVSHLESKSKLIKYVNTRLLRQAEINHKNPPDPEDLFDTKTLTIAIARRPVSYKRPLLLYSDIERLLKIGSHKIQIVQCGKSHPNDPISQNFVREIINISNQLRGKIRVAYLENYSPKIARVLVSGSDVWLNTPKRPLEASGTSGMKAALNGVLNFSILDGWWTEGYNQDANSGFSIGPQIDSVFQNSDDSEDVNSLYDTLEKQIIPMYYDNFPLWLSKMKSAIALSSHYTTHRVVSDHLNIAWK